jgi:hypothetical protein
MRGLFRVFLFPRTLFTKATGSTSLLPPHPLSPKLITTGSWKSWKENAQVMVSLSTRVRARQGTRTPSADLGPVPSIDCLFLSSENSAASFQSSLCPQTTTARSGFCSGPAYLSELDEKEQRKIRLMLSRRWKTI